MSNDRSVEVLERAVRLLEHLEARSRPPRRTEPLPLELDPAAEYDRLGRKQPHRLGYVQLARALPGYAAQFTRTVPDEFIAQVDDGVVEVACPCGGTPRLAWMTPTLCACDRSFVNTGTTVRVATVTGDDHS